MRTLRGKHRRHLRRRLVDGGGLHEVETVRAVPQRAEENRKLTLTYGKLKRVLDFNVTITDSVLP